MAAQVSATEARVHFGDLLKRVAERRETVIVERSGAPQVAVLPLPEYERLLALEGNGDWGDLFQETMAMVDRDLAGKTAPDADDLIHEMRRERDAELLDLP